MAVSSSVLTLGLLYTNQIRDQNFWLVDLSGLLFKLSENLKAGKMGANAYIFWCFCIFLMKTYALQAKISKQRNKQINCIIVHSFIYQVNTYRDLECYSWVCNNK